MYSYFSLDFLHDLFPHLVRIFIPSLVMQLLINTPSSYFRLMDNFTGLIEFIVGVIWSLFYAWQIQAESLQFRQILVALYVILWSLRLGGFLVYRMFALGPLDTRIEDIAKKHGQLAIIGIWLGPHGFWSVICCLPIALLHAFPISDVDFNMIDFIGSIFWICGFLMEAIADGNKLKAKLARTKKYYHLGFLWDYCRNPNHCGEIFCWLGLSIIAFNLVFYHPLYQYNIFMAISLLISPLFTLSIMLFEATLGSEINNNKRFNNQVDYRQYRKQTSIIWPIPSAVYLRLPKWIKRMVFFEWDIYNEGLRDKSQ